MYSPGIHACSITLVKMVGKKIHSYYVYQLSAKYIHEHECAHLHTGVPTSVNKG